MHTTDILDVRRRMHSRLLGAIHSREGAVPRSKSLAVFIFGYYFGRTELKFCHHI